VKILRGELTTYEHRSDESSRWLRFEFCPACVSPGECRQASSCRGMRAHLEGCPACAEEYESLKALLADSGHA